MRSQKRNIKIINNEIDYQKLAKVIVETQNKEEKIGKDTGKLRNSAMRFLNGIIYSFFYVVAGLFIYNVWADFYHEQNMSLVSCIILTALLLFVGFYSFLCQQESFQDEKSNTHEYFNSNMTFIALIVAIVSLLKNV